MAIHFELAADEACDHTQAPVFAKVWRKIPGRQLLAEQEQLSPNFSRINYRSPTMLMDRSILDGANVKPQYATMLEWYRLCHHRGLWRAERIAIHVIEHAGATEVAIKPVNNPRPDACGMAQFEAAKNSKGFGPHRAAVYETLATERQAHPCTAILVQQTVGNVALRGLETRIPFEELC